MKRQYFSFCFTKSGITESGMAGRGKQSPFCDHNYWLKIKIIKIYILKLHQNSQIAISTKIA